MNLLGLIVRCIITSQSVSWVFWATTIFNVIYELAKIKCENCRCYCTFDAHHSIHASYRKSIEKSHWEIPLRNPIEKSHWEIPLRNPIEKFHWEIPLRNPIEKSHWEIPLRNPIEKSHWEIPLRNPIEKSHWEIPLRNPIEKSHWEIPLRNWSLKFSFILSDLSYSSRKV